MHENEIGNYIVDAAIAVHREIGPGLLESVYESILAYQLTKEGLIVRRQVPIAIEFDGNRIEEGFRADLIVEMKVIIELKSIERLNRAHHKQLLTYLKLSGLRLGYLLNFSEELMKFGIHRKANNLE